MDKDHVSSTNVDDMSFEDTSVSEDASHTHGSVLDEDPLPPLTKENQVIIGTSLEPPVISDMPLNGSLVANTPILESIVPHLKTEPLKKLPTSSTVSKRPRHKPNIRKELLNKAVQDVINEKISMRQAAQRYEIAKSSLCDYVRKNNISLPSVRYKSYMNSDRNRLTNASNAKSMVPTCTSVSLASTLTSNSSPMSDVSAKLVSAAKRMKTSVLPNGGKVAEMKSAESIGNSITDTSTHPFHQPSNFITPGPGGLIPQANVLSTIFSFFNSGQFQHSPTTPGPHPHQQQALFTANGWPATAAPLMAPNNLGFKNWAVLLNNGGVNSPSSSSVASGAQRSVAVNGAGSLKVAPGVSVKLNGAAPSSPSGEHSQKEEGDIENTSGEQNGITSDESAMNDSKRMETDCWTTGENQNTTSATSKGEPNSPSHSSSPAVGNRTSNLPGISTSASTLQGSIAGLINAPLLSTAVKSDQSLVGSLNSNISPTATALNPCADTSLSPVTLNNLISQQNSLSAPFSNPLISPAFANILASPFLFPQVQNLFPYLQPPPPQQPPSISGGDHLDLKTAIESVPKVASSDLINTSEGNSVINTDSSKESLHNNLLPQSHLIYPQSCQATRISSIINSPLANQSSSINTHCINTPLPSNEMTQQAKELIKFINQSPTPFHAVRTAKDRLLANGFRELNERDPWSLRPNDRVFISRNDSTLYAVTVGGKFKLGEGGFSMFGAHTDSPCLRLKPCSDRTKEGYQQMAVETYGGGLWYTWFDRDLTIAGRCMLRRQGEEFGMEQRLVHFKRPLACVPSLCIHLNREANKSFSPNTEQNLAPILSTAVYDQLQSNVLKEKEGGTNAGDSNSLRHSTALLTALAKEMKCQPSDIIDMELYLADTQPACLGGIHEEFVHAPRLDNLFNTYCGMEALLAALPTLEADCQMRVACFFDHEEIGSTSAQGADSVTTALLLKRLAMAVEGQSDANESFDGLYQMSLAQSFLVSADQAHAVHPNFSDKHEEKHRPTLHDGVVLKYNCNQRYATNAYTASVIRLIADKAKVPIQEFVVRQDIGCGSTIGPLLSSQLGIPTVDMGSPQLAMHSCREFCGISSVKHAIDLYACFFSNYAQVAKNFCVADSTTGGKKA